jgi:hypothetical protein
MKKYIFIIISSWMLLLAGGSRVEAQTCACNCLKPFFDYLIANNMLFARPSAPIPVAEIIRLANYQGYNISYTECAILSRNIGKSFYATSTSGVGTLYSARIGDCEVTITASGAAVNFSQLKSSACAGQDVVNYSLTVGGSTAATLKIGNCYVTTTTPSGICYSAVTDTSVNAYTTGVAGNWRPVKSYTYYSDRAETTTDVAVKLRKGGTIPGFVPFWSLSSNGWTAQQDTTKWVWNTRSTLFNRKGMEMETVDPLGRYTSGLYGYDDALMTAAVQNARFREAAYDGFEDYFFTVPACNATCSVTRAFDFSSYVSQLDTTQQHSGKYSLRVNAGQTISVSTVVTPVNDSTAQFTATTDTLDCNGAPEFAGIRIGKNALLPTFSPLAGKRILFSAWVKEALSQPVATYAGDSIDIIIKGATTSTVITAAPKGGIIEGWQRYEQVIDVPADASVFSIQLRTIQGTTAYFDDIRIHPFNANMKSFVYDPQNLRLMAELDENNYATFYEYDDEGTLIRVKKETERGVKTITETRSTLLKTN